MIAAVKTLLGVFQPCVEKLPLEIRGEHFEMSEMASDAFLNNYLNN